jgi:hypothetical protein
MHISSIGQKPFTKAHIYDAALRPFTAAFLLLCALHALLFAAAMRLPLLLPKAAKPQVIEVADVLENISK